VPAERGLNPTADGGTDAVREIHFSAVKTTKATTMPLAANPMPLCNPVKNPDFATISGAFPLSSAIADLSLLFSTRDRQIHKSTRPKPGNR
jgi:hypothetical protein